MKKYDYIIAGSGCAGLSLLYRILKEPTLQHKSILVIDKDSKKNNDRTWCYWEKEAGIFDKLVSAKWNNLAFITTDFKKHLDLGSYTYKMIQGLDFYQYVLNYAQKFTNVTFIQENILSISSDDSVGIVKTNIASYTSKVVFNSTSLFNPVITEQNSLLQHFKGWVIKTETAQFDKNVGRLMDFTVSQEHGATFMYVLPTSSTEALVEYTLFTPKLIEKEDYKKALVKYIKEDLKIEKYTITHEEFGIIPMSLANFKRTVDKTIINMGTAGGFTKASSGYTFQFIQKNVSEIILDLKNNRPILNKTTFKDKLYNWYDRTLIDVLLSNKLTGKEVFTRIFKKNSPEKILAFLGNESSLKEDVLIMKNLPLLPFLIAGIRQLFTKR
ncbi:lycopene cyclase family protein [Polaribacter sp. KT 15]|uniref:lycopene cyclase family protein n=1 Tax=Polaribacter sp. KT 15 TaxID=1896175 RepID=UPI000909741B|nr:lycopene cyclase family protein [Polaribacter sp. KT 15]SHM96105.1 lycopene beta-cyclase [Polaribacter sp. KT 15]